MELLIAALALLAAGGVLSLAASFRPPLALALGSASAALACAVGLVPAVATLLSGSTHALTFDWAVGYGAVTLRLDPLGALFLCTVFGLGLPASVFGAAYMRAHGSRWSLGGFGLFFNALLGAMATLCVAGHAFLFLFAWEVMSIASFFLVAFEHESAEVRAAGRLYLVASHLGAAFLFALFVLMGRRCGSLDFAAMGALKSVPAGTAWLFFALGLLGFGVKAGFMPLHVWLPEAHPAAPSHVSALMSGAMVKMGLLGLLRLLALLPPAPQAWGWLLIGIGLVGAALGIALALGQRDLKRALAYSTVENVGLIAAGIGLGLLGAARGQPVVSALGWAAALLHVWNHALMKGLLFLGAGAVVHGVGTRDLEAMGGLMKRMPQAATLFLVGAAAISALPPLNGFIGEWLLYLGLANATAWGGFGALAVALAVAALAVVGALAAIAFTRVAGMALLGTPRSAAAAHAHEPSALMVAPMAVMVLACAAIGIFPAGALRLAGPGVAQAAGASPAVLAALLGPHLATFAGPMPALAAGLVAAIAALAFVRSRRLAARSAASGTWGCGYAAPTARMQYTAASYTQLVSSTLLPRGARPHSHHALDAGVFPRHGALAVQARDPARHRLFWPLFLFVEDRLVRLRNYQASLLNLQLVYPLAALVLLALLFTLRGLTP